MELDYTSLALWHSVHTGHSLETSTPTVDAQCPNGWNIRLNGCMYVCQES